MALNHQPQHLSSSASSDDEEVEEDTSSSSSEEQAVEVSSSEEEDHQIPTPLPKKPSAQNQPKIPSSHPQSSSDPKIKPISSKIKPVAEDPPSKSAAKHKSQKAKRKARDVEVETTEEKKNVDDRNNKKPLLFSQGDEIVILESLIEYGLKKGVERRPDIKGFHKFVKKSLSFVGATKTQLYEKLRRLREKYKRNAMKGNPGVFAKPHEVKVFELSKKIWENNDGGNGLGNEGVRKRRKRGSVGLPKDGEKSEVERMGMGTGFEISAGGFGSVGFLGSVGGWSLNEEAVKILKDGLELINESDKLELEGKWEQMMVEEVEHYLKKLDLIHEQTMLVLEAMKS